MDQNENTNALPPWAVQVLRCPDCRAGLTFTGAEARCAKCGPSGQVEEGILRVGVREEDPTIQWYRKKGGASFNERRQVAYSMSSLDTPVYHNYLSDLRPPSLHAVIVDVGAGDGRNTMPWLEWGYRRVIATDPVAAALQRMRERLQAEHPAWLSHILFIECDARCLPLATESADLLLAIEALCCLNEAYDEGLRECVRILKDSGQFFLSERAWEGSSLMRLLYGGIPEMLRLSGSRDLWDGAGSELARTRCFTEDELVAAARDQGLAVAETKGLSVFSVILGYLRGEGKLPSEHGVLLPQVEAMLLQLGETSQMRRAHVVVGGKATF